jgi:hypothetical protein
MAIILGIAFFSVRSNDPAGRRLALGPACFFTLQTGGELVFYPILPGGSWLFCPSALETGANQGNADSFSGCEIRACPLRYRLCQGPKHSMPEYLSSLSADPDGATCK